MSFQNIKQELSTKFCFALAPYNTHVWTSTFTNYRCLDSREVISFRDYTNHKTIAVLDKLCEQKMIIHRFFICQQAVKDD